MQAWGRAEPFLKSFHFYPSIFTLVTSRTAYVSFIPSFQEGKLRFRVLRAPHCRFVELIDAVGPIPVPARDDS